MPGSNNLDNSIKSNWEGLTLHKLHQIILSKNTLPDALKELSIKKPDTLYRRLSVLHTSYKQLKKKLTTEEKGEGYFKSAYDKVVNISKKSEELTLAKIHPVIRQKSIRSEYAAARKLQIPKMTLLRILGRYETDFECLKPMSVDAAREKFFNYDTVPPKKVDLSKFPLSYVHEFITRNEKRNKDEPSSVVAARLGVSHNTLNRYLTNKRTSFDKLKDLTKENAVKEFGQHYYDIVKSDKKLNILSRREVQEVISNSITPTEAAANLGVTPEALVSHLSRKKRKRSDNENYKHTSRKSGRVPSNQKLGTTTATVTQRLKELNMEPNTSKKSRKKITTRVVKIDINSSKKRKKSSNDDDDDDYKFTGRKWIATTTTLEERKKLRTANNKFIIFSSSTPIDKDVSVNLEASKIEVVKIS